MSDRILSLAKHVDRIELDRELCKDFKIFVRKAWKYVEPGTPYKHGKHIDVVCNYLTAVRDGEIGKIIINIPPGHTKSTLCNILFPAWCWTTNPFWRFMAASYAASLSTRDAIKMRELVKSDWYQKRWGHLVQIDNNRDTQVDFWTTQRGQRYSTSVGGSATGFHAHVQLIDDPINATQALSELERNTANRWLSETLSTRWVAGCMQRQVIIMQRLHENDPTGYLLERGGYEHVCLREEFEPGIYSTKLGNYEWRTSPGELLWPEVYTPEIHQMRKDDLRAYGTAGQLQQRPAPDEGGLIKAEYFKRYNPNFPKEYQKYIISADLRFTSRADSGDFVAFMVLGKNGAQTDILDVINERLDFDQCLAALRGLAKKWPRAYTKLIEKAANGDALENLLKKEIPGIQLVPPQGSKAARVQASLPFLAAGNIALPEQGPGRPYLPWVDLFVHQCKQFPNAAHDDMVDAMTQGLIHLYIDQADDYFEIMGRA